MSSQFTVHSSQLKVAVLMGGPSREREISMRSGRAVSDALRRLGYDVHDIIEMDQLPEQLKASQVKVAFIALHGEFGEDGKVQQILEDYGIPYTGSGPESSFLALRKDLAKTKFNEAGIPTPAGFWGEIKENDEEKANSLGFPLVIKPVAEGSSIGLEIVKTRDDFALALKRVRVLTQEILIEKYVAGAELTVGILGNEPLPIVQIKTDRKFYDFEAKYSPGHTEYEVPARVDPSLYSKVQELGLKAHHALGCRDFSRVDILLDANGMSWVLEVNTIPGFTEKSLLPKAASAAGISFDNLCDKILKLALNRRIFHATSKTVRV